MRGHRLGWRYTLSPQTRRPREVRARAATEPPASSLMRHDENDAAAVVDAPPRCRRDAVEVADRLDVRDVDVPEGLDATEAGVIDVDAHGRLEGVGSFHL